MALVAHSSNFKDVNTRGGTANPTGDTLAKDKTSSAKSIL
jgi:hypothetical protein